LTSLIISWNVVPYNFSEQEKSIHMFAVKSQTYYEHNKNFSLFTLLQEKQMLEN